VRRYFVVSLAIGSLMSFAAARAATIRVTIENISFSPAEIAAKVGDTVEWINKDFVDHSATVDGQWDVMIAASKSGSLVLKNAGTFDYYCRFHPNMKGRITVSPP
jgi:plastocyanin